MEATPQTNLAPPLINRAFTVALTAARRGPRGANPLVGAALTWPDGTIITAYHQGSGTPHAEVAVISRYHAHPTLPTTHPLTQSTLIVTLEPCNHIGRTGPCTQAIIATGIPRVIFGTPDPNPQSADGMRSLHQAGISATPIDAIPGGAPLGHSARHLNARWTRSIAQRRPFITAKLAQSLDGCLAAHDSTSRWITSEPARDHAHQTRARVNAIAVGTGTANADNPHLTTRTTPPPTHQPVPVVFGTRALPTGSHLATNPATLTYPTIEAGLSDLHARGRRHLLLEGGPTLLAEFLTRDLVDELHVYIAPILLGNGIRPPLDIPTLTQAHGFDLDAKPEVIGPDIFLRYIPRAALTPPANT